MLLRSRTPAHREIQKRGHLPEVFEQPALPQITGKRMDHREVFDRRGRDHNVRDSSSGRRECGEKRERKVLDRIAKFRAVRSVPGIDRVERFKIGNADAFDDSHQIERGVRKRSCAIGKANQGEHRARSPDLGI